MTLKSLFRRAYQSARQDSIILARVGRHNPDTSVDYAVPGRVDYLFVTLPDKTVVAARNEAGVPQTVDLGIKLRVEHGTYVIVGRSTSGALTVPSETPPSGVYAHGSSHLAAGSDPVLTAANVAAVLHGASAKTTPVNADTMPLIDSADSNALKKVTWANIVATIQAALTTVFNALYAPIAKGVTNGDSHDHNGGDGGTLNSDNITEGSTNLFFTTAEETKLAGIETGADVTDAGNVGSAVNAATTDDTIADTDVFPYATGSTLKKTAWSVIRDTLKTYLDTVYTAINTAVLLTTDQTVAGVKTFTSNVVASVIRQAVETGTLTLMGGTSTTQGPYIALFGKDAGGGNDGNVQIIATTESAAAGLIEFWKYDGTTFTRLAYFNPSDSSLVMDGGPTIRTDDNTSIFSLLGGVSGTDGPYIQLVGKDVGGGSDGNVVLLATTESSAAGLIEFWKYNGTTATRMGYLDPATNHLNLIGGVITNNGSFFQSKLVDNTIIRIFGIGGDNIAYFGGIDAALTEMRVRTAGVDRIQIDSNGRSLFGGLTSGGAQWLGVKAGTSTNDAAVGGVLYADSTQYANGTTVETDLAAYSVPANTLAVNNQSLEFHAWGTMVNNGNTKTLKLYFGADSFTLGAVTVGVITWSVQGRIIRTGAATQKVVADINIGGATVLVSTAARTLSGANTLKLTGQSSAASNDILQQGFIVKWLDSNT